MIPGNVSLTISSCIREHMNIGDVPWIACPTPRCYGARVEDARIIAAMAALAHPTRLSAYRAVAAAGPAGIGAGALANALGVKPNVLSPHLASLVRSGLVAREERGTRSLFRIESFVIADLREALGRLLSS